MLLVICGALGWLLTADAALAQNLPAPPQFEVLDIPEMPGGAGGGDADAGVLDALDAFGAAVEAGGAEQPDGGDASDAAQGAGADVFESLIPDQFSINFAGGNQPQKLSTGIKILLLMTVLTLAPSILIMLTSFIRIVIVLSFIKRALGLQDIPPPQVVIGLALFLTFFVMSPVINRVRAEAFEPYMQEQLSEQAALQQALAPLREFMFNQTRKKDLILFINIAQIPQPEVRGDVPTWVLIPAFVISELKTAFLIGFIIYLPFLVIDMVISALLLSMGMMMLPPVIISLPFKVILFVLVDGWYLIVGSLIQSFNTA